MKLAPQDMKGQVFLKFLWQHADYQNGSGELSPLLIEDLKRHAKRDNLTPSQLFLWINHSGVIPRWARLAAFQLAMEKGWQPIDLLDVLSVVYLDAELIEKVGLQNVVETYKLDHGVVFPSPLIEKALNYDFLS